MSFDLRTSTRIGLDRDLDDLKKIDDHLAFIIKVIPPGKSMVELNDACDLLRRAIMRIDIAKHNL